MDFEWDDAKAESNYQKHRIRFSEAATVWQDEAALEIPDPEHSKSEERWIRLGVSRNANILVVVYCEKIEGELIRIISSRAANKEESKLYHQR